MPEATRMTTKVRSFGFCFLSFIKDSRGMSALDAIMQAINPAWVPEIEAPTDAE